MAQEAPQDSAGPSSPPPALPEGWLAQWEGLSRKWYYVQRATGKSQWEIPTEPVILTPSTTPTSSETGPTRAPGSRPQTNSPQAAAGLAAGGSVNGTERAGISSFFGSQGNPQHGGFSQMAAGMLNRLPNQLFHAKSNEYTQHTQQSHPGGAYGAASSGHGLMGVLSQYQNGHQQNSFGYSSSGQLGTYTGSTPQYQPAGQQAVGQAPVAQAHSVSGLNGSSPQPVAGFAGNYAVNHSGSLSSQFALSASSSQHYPVQPMMPSGLNQYQASATTTLSGMGSSQVSVPSVTQPQWQLGPQPTVPLSTKPSMTQASPNPGGSQYNQLSPAYPLQQPNQSFTSAYPATQTVNAYGHAGVSQPFSAQPLDPFGKSSHTIQGSLQSFSGVQGPPGLVNQHGQLHTSNAYSQYPSYQAGQQSSLFTSNSSSMSTPPATASGFANTSPLGAVPFGTSYPGTQSSILSTQHSNTSLSSHFGSTTQQLNDSGAVAELPDSQVGASHYTHPTQNQVSQAAVPAQGSFQQQQQSLYPFGTVNELAGSEAHRPELTDPQFVSGPWTSSYPQQSRYGQYGGAFR
ncbi:hypothetical protein VTN77DRAFT_1499 [Rasamsonia byssochlamydoides]|uniref:uncharacterized protein n=1 Tax=Rasamsonia byssochlamydoides TaxID=89139 RepID=UPI003743A484